MYDERKNQQDLYNQHTARSQELQPPDLERKMVFWLWLGRNWFSILNALFIAGFFFFNLGKYESKKMSRSEIVQMVENQKKTNGFDRCFLKIDAAKLQGRVETLEVRVKHNKEALNFLRELGILNGRKHK